MVKQGDVLVVLDDGTAEPRYEAIRQNYLCSGHSKPAAGRAGRTSPSISFTPTCSRPRTRRQCSTCACSSSLFAARRSAVHSEIARRQQAIVGHRRADRWPDPHAGKPAGAGSAADQPARQRHRAGQRGLCAAQPGAATRTGAGRAAQFSLAELETNVQRTRSAIAETGCALPSASRNTSRRCPPSWPMFDARCRPTRSAWWPSPPIWPERRSARRWTARWWLLAMSSAGGVVTPGQKLMDIVPAR
jgi:hypothetical protein